MKAKTLKGRKFGKLLVLSKHDNIGKNTAWFCECECGVRKPVLTHNLLSGKSKSCGCVRGKKLGNFSRIHGGSGTKIYSIYKGMKQRCNNNKNPAYKYYGGKGVIICSEWLENFVFFRKWAFDNGYKEGLSIDRIDPNGGYNPENCRWITLHQQQNNKLNSMFVIVDNKKYTIAEWADIRKTNKQTLYDRFYRLLDQLGVDNKNALSFEIKTRERV